MLMNHKVINPEEITKVYLKSQNISEKFEPNLIILWRCNEEIRKKAKDEFHEHRKMYGMLFICHVMGPIDSK